MVRRSALIVQICVGLPLMVLYPRYAGMEIPSLWKQPIADWLLTFAAKASSVETIKHRRHQIKRLAWDFPNRSPWTLRTDELIAWIAGKGWARETMRSHRTALNQFFEFGRKHEYIAINVAEDLPCIKEIIGEPRPAPRDVITEAMLDAERRVRLMIRLGTQLGMRRGEVALVHLSDVVETTHGKKALIVHGKGGKERTLPIPADLATILKTEAKEHDGWLFPGRIDGHLSGAYIGKLVSRALGEFTMHQHRHTFGMDVLDQTDNISIVQNLMGHASPVTTQRYCRPTDEKMRDAVDNHSQTWNF